MNIRSHSGRQRQPWLLSVTLMGCLLSAINSGPAAFAAEDGPTASDSRLKLEGFTEKKPIAENNKSTRKSFFRFADGKLQTYGEVVEVDAQGKASAKGAKSEKKFRDAYDLFLDADHGLATNAKIKGCKLGVGKAGIVDMGAMELDAVKEAPNRGYKEALDTSEIVAGHTYCVRTANGRDYGKLHVISFDSDQATLESEWHFQSSGARLFDKQ